MLGRHAPWAKRRLGAVCTVEEYERGPTFINQNNQNAIPRSKLWNIWQRGIMGRTRRQGDGRDPICGDVNTECCRTNARENCQ